LQASVGESGLQRLIGSAGDLANLLRQGWIDPKRGKRNAGSLQEAPAVGHFYSSQFLLGTTLALPVQSGNHLGRGIRTQ
jgi:hypothetical protein